MTLSELVSGKVQFLRYRNGELWYRTQPGGFDFPVPISDTGSEVFYTEDRAILFMCWIRAHLELTGKLSAFVERKTEIHDRDCGVHTSGCTCTPREARE